MNFISDYKYIIIPFLVWFSIQLFKVICDVIRTKKFELKRIMGAGGMPSSHSAVVTVLATLIGKNEGFNTAIFGFSVIFACVVMYDAMGVRREAGNHAKIINKIINKITIMCFFIITPFVFSIFISYMHFFDFIVSKGSTVVADTFRVSISKKYPLNPLR